MYIAGETLGMGGFKKPDAHPEMVECKMTG